MSYKPLLSVILCFQNQRDVVESTLSSLFDLSSVPFELYIIDDASTDGTDDAIQSLLDYYDPDHTFFFRHEHPSGRGNSLNEILSQLNSPLLWAPISLEQVNEQALLKVVERAAGSEAGCFLQDERLPDSFGGWLKQADSQEWPLDNAFLWNLDNIPSVERFFNPYQHQFHSMELAARLHSASALEVETISKISTRSTMDREITPGPDERKELVFSLLRRSSPGGDDFQQAMNLIKGAGTATTEGHPPEQENKLLAEALRLQKDGRFSSALELVDHVLEQNPQHPKAKKLKVQILEKKRRFVEASELKHEIDSEEARGGGQEAVKTSIIIPTALHGKGVLEHCLITLAEHCDAEHLELIVIDNASLDDTHDYLAELEEKNFLNCSVITNSHNKGFAASVNQGLEQAEGDYGLVLHNDVSLKSNLPKELEDLMDAHPSYGIIGPLADKTLNPDQSVRNREHYDTELVRTEYLDSFCMMIRLDSGLRMDEEYELAFFEDIDLCFEARKRGYKIGIATEVEVEHSYGTSTFALTLDTESEQYWKNVAYFNDKWDVSVYSEEELKSRSTFDQLLALDELVNPMFPEDALKDYFEELFTDELKTEMMRSEHDPETLCKLVHLMMVMEKRDVMRRLEDRLDSVELPASLIYQLVRFYFNRNIYSRCLHYLKRLKSEQQSLLSELYKLEIMISDKELEQAVPKLSELLEKAPSHPTLYKLAGDIHEFEGNREEAQSFYEIAHQLNPFEYSETGDKEFKLKKE